MPLMNTIPLPCSGWQAMFVLVESVNLKLSRWPMVILPATNLIAFPFSVLVIQEPLPSPTAILVLDSGTSLCELPHVQERKAHC